MYAENIKELDLDVISTKSQSISESITKRLDWLIQSKHLQYDELLMSQINKSVCRMLYISSNNLITDVKNKLLLLDIDMLSQIFDTFNRYSLHGPAIHDWRISFLTEYINTDNINNVKSILLPKTSVVYELSTFHGAHIARTFNLPTNVQELFDFQLSHGSIFCVHHKYELLPDGFTIFIDGATHDQIIILKPELKDVFVEASKTNY